jgi:L-rhamnose mutarotase
LAEHTAALKDGIDNSDAQAEWDDRMDPILEDDEDIWLDEVYRMI